METIAKAEQIIRRKPLLFILTAVIYFAAVILLKWNTKLSLNTLLFLVGGLTGIYIIDATEAFINIKPSPFHSALFGYGFILISFYIISSSGSFLASGLVLSVYITMILWQLGQLKLTSNLDSWYRTATGPVAKRNQLLLFTIFLALFITESLMFIRQPLL
jgi:hypothetical protein